MTGVAIMVADQCRRIVAAATRATAMSVHAMAGHEHHLHPLLFKAKPFPGQATVAANCARSCVPRATCTRPRSRVAARSLFSALCTHT
jgi:histidine ammonia-lyase